MKSFAMLFVVFTAFIGLARPADAQTQGLEVQVTVLGHSSAVRGSSSDHFLTFNGPVELPGVGLAPGVYIFRFVAPAMMQVLNENRSIVYATFFVTPTLRSKVTDDYAMTLRRIQNDAPARMTTLFPPEAWEGYELMYPQIDNRRSKHVRILLD